jgi:hypothetical protein
MCLHLNSTFLMLLLASSHCSLIPLQSSRNDVYNCTTMVFNTIFGCINPQEWMKRRKLPLEAASILWWIHPIATPHFRWFGP